ncbi:MAG: polysaccharide biosynthesis tyrosine autokinase [Pseudomonadales bacterium]
MSKMDIPGNFAEPRSIEDFINLRQLWRSLVRYKWGILGLAFAFALVTGLVVFSMEPIYQAKASLIIEAQEAKIVNIEDVYNRGYADYEYYQTEYEILKSRRLAERVARKPEIHKHPYFSPKKEVKRGVWFKLRSLLPTGKEVPPVQKIKLSAEKLEERAIARASGVVAGGLTVTPVQFSHMVNLSFQSTDPKLAALIVNTVVEEYINQQLDSRLMQSERATSWLNERLVGLKDELGKSEQRLQDFRDREQLVDISGVATMGTQELNQLTTRLAEVRRARVEAENIQREVQNLGENPDIDALLTLSAVREHSLISKLLDAQSEFERNVAELAKRYGAKHPKMISAQTELDAANYDLEEEIYKVVPNINRQYQLALRNERQIESQLAASKSGLQDINRKEFKLSELQREVDTNRHLYETFFTRIKETGETGGLAKAHARLLDAALVPGGPIKPRKSQSILLAFILGVIFGCAIAVLLEILDNTIKHPEEVVEKLEVPLLGSLQVMPTDKQGNIEFFWADKKSAYAEAIRTIRTGIILSSLDNPSKVIVVTSAIPGEGKSTVSLNLGSALAQMEKTLVIGADMRRPTLAKRCNLPPNHKGLSSFVAGTATLEECIAHIDEGDLHVMPSGIVPPNPLEMLSSKKFVGALEKLKQKFDRIVIDSAPTQAASDALILASYADSVIYVVRADKTPATLAKRGIRSIIGSNEPLTGVVLNQFDPKKASAYYGSKYNHYYEYYQADKES